MISAHMIAGELLGRRGKDCEREPRHKSLQLFYSLALRYWGCRSERGVCYEKPRIWANNKKSLEYRHPRLLAAVGCVVWTAKCADMAVRVCLYEW